MSHREHTNTHALAQVPRKRCHRMFTSMVAERRAGEHGRLNSASTTARAVGKRTAGKACSTAKATATANAAAVVSHRKGSQYREVRRQRVSLLDLLHLSFSLYHTTQHRGSAEMVRTTMSAQSVVVCCLHDACVHQPQTEFKHILRKKIRASSTAERGRLIKWKTENQDAFCLTKFTSSRTAGRKSVAAELEIQGRKISTAEGKVVPMEMRCS